MTDKQAERVRQLFENGTPGRAMNVGTVPDGSLVVWAPNWLEVIEPEPTGILSWDMGGPTVDRRVL